MIKIISCLATILLFSLNLQVFSMDYTKLSHRIVGAYSHELAEKKGLFFDGGGGAMMCDIKIISVSYTAFDALNIEGARKLYVEVMEEYLRRINADKSIRPYLHNYPFLYENVELRIGFDDVSGNMMGNGYVSLMHLVRHKIYYKGYDSEKREFYTLHEETYEQAKQIVLGCQ